MRIYMKFIILILFTTQLSNAWALQNNRYVLGAGEVIRIQVFGEEDLTIESIRLGQSGVINYPYLGNIRLAGLTLNQAENLIIEGLKGDYLINPDVSVSIVEYRPFYVSGEVKSPGGYAFEPGLTVKKAIAVAGGFSERAAKSKFSVTRKTSQGERTFTLRMNDSVRPGDVIIVDSSFF